MKKHKNYQKSASLESRRAFFLALAMICIGLFLISFVSADTKTYDPNKKEVKIKDNSNVELANFKLIWNTYNCGGDDLCYAIIEANITTKKKDVFSKLDFIKLKGNGDITNLKIEYTLPNGSYATYDKNLDYEGKFRIKISGYKLPEDSVDWVPTLYGLEINEWAIWDTEYTYDNFNDASINWSLWVNNSNRYWSETGGKLIYYQGVSNCGDNVYGNSTNVFPNLYSIKNVTIRSRVYCTAGGPGGTSFSILYFYGGEIKGFTCNPGQTFDDTSTWTIIRNESTTTQQFLVYNDSVFSHTITGTPTSNGILMYTASNCNNGATGQIELDYVYYTIGNTSMNITLHSPTSLVYYANVTFNITANVTVNTLQNISLYIDGIYNNSKDISGTQNTTQFYTPVPVGTHNWSVYVCDSDANCKYSNMQSFYANPFLENSNTYNATTYEIFTEGFILNMTYDSSTYTSSSASLIYNGVSYTGTKIGTGNTVLFTRSVTIPTITSPTNYSFYWNISLTNSTATTYYNSTTYNQSISRVIFSRCNSTNTISYLNFSFKDESTNSAMTAFVDSSTFIYWIGDSSVNKTYTFVNTTAVNSSYAFCFTPGFKPITMNVEFKYSNTSYPQRTWAYTSQSFTNSTTQKTLYLLGSTVGQYVAFQVVDVASAALSGVTVTATKVIAGVSTLVEQGTTGADGLVTFWLDPNYVHTIVASKSGYGSYTGSITPTQTQYTIQLGGATASVNAQDYFKGISYRIYPTDDYLLNGTTYYFNFSLTSEYWTVTEFGFDLINSTNGILASAVLYTNGGNAYTALNTGNLTWIGMNYYYIINGTRIDMARHGWGVFNEEYKQYSLWKFFDDLKTYSSQGMFGLTANGFALICFFIVLVSTGIFAFKFGIGNPLLVSGFAFIMFLLFDIGLNLMVNPVGAIPHFLTFLSGIILLIMIIRSMQ